MPYASDKQARLMRAVAHSPSFAKKVGISQSVGQKFEAHKAEGGTVKDSAMKKIFAGKETPAEERKEKAVAKKAGMSYKAAERKFEGEKYCGGGKTGYADGGETSFKEAFRAARAAGDDTFTWNGKKYTTELATPSPVRGARAGAPEAPTTRAQRAGSDFSTYDRLLREAPEGTSKAALAALAASRDAARSKYDQSAEDTPNKGYVSRAGTRANSPLAPKTTVGRTPAPKAPYMPEELDTSYAKGGRVNPGLTPDMPDSEDQLRDARKAKPVPPRRVNPGLTPDLADSKEQERGYKKGGSVRGVGAAKRGYGCTGRK